MSANLSDLLEPPSRQHAPPTFPASHSYGERVTGIEDLRRKLKRQKTRHDGDVPTNSAMRYGREGQVVAGKLKMRIVSCDGGSYRGERSGDRADNILRDNDSVYCTKNSACNVLLSHYDESTFALESIVIKAPKSGYTHPSVQEGLIFVSMSESELCNNTDYHIRYPDPARHSSSSSPSPPPHRPQSRSRDDEPLSLMSALNDPEIWEASQERQRMAQRARGIEERMHDLNERRRFVEQGDRILDRARPRADSSIRLDQRDGFSERYQALRRREVVHDAIERMGERNSWPSRRATDSYRPDNENCDWPTPEESNTRVSPSDHSPTAPTPPPFIITTESDDNDSEPETNPRERMRDVYLAERLRREGRASYRRQSPEEDPDADPDADDLDFTSLSHMMRDD
ncbi:hypothetical protein LTS18_010927, partial [Coniosporium uncinatum]